MEEAGRMEKPRFKRNYVNYNVMFLTFFILAFGLVIIYSASSFKAITKFGDEFFFVKSQLAGIVMGLFAMLFIGYCVDYRILTVPLFKINGLKVNLVGLAFVGSNILQILVLLVGVEHNGSKRWLKIMGKEFEPSEICKIAAILMTAYLICKAPKALDTVWGYVRICVYFAVLLVCVVKENLSTAAIVFAIITGLCIIASRKKNYFIVIMVCVALVGTIYLNTGDGYRQERIAAWKNVETHEKGYQTLQGLYAIASGGMFGSGLGQSMQKLGYIPEAQNDMIFTIVCEELGLVGAGALMLLFILLIWNIIQVAEQAPDMFGSLICMGVMIQIAVQVILNIGVVTNTFPNTGVSLPFISCGGTSVAIQMAEIGIVLSVSRSIRRY